MEAKAAQTAHSKKVKSEQKNLEQRLVQEHVLKLEIGKELEKLNTSTFSDPMAYAVMQLIGTKAVTGMDGLRRAFPKEVGLDAFLGKIVNELEGAGVIFVDEDGDIHLTRLWTSVAKQFPEMHSVYPALLQVSMKKIITEANSGVAVQNCNFAGVISLADSPTIRARLRRLRAIVEEEFSQMKLESEKKPGRGFRTVSFLTCKLEGEDFL